MKSWTWRRVPNASERSASRCCIGRESRVSRSVCRGSVGRESSFSRPLPSRPNPPSSSSRPRSGTRIRRPSPTSSKTALSSQLLGMATSLRSSSRPSSTRRVSRLDSGTTWRSCGLRPRLRPRLKPTPRPPRKFVPWCSLTPLRLFLLLPLYLLPACLPVYSSTESPAERRDRPLLVPSLPSSGKPRRQSRSFRCDRNCILSEENNKPALL
mmetsp:Transcript_3985/g.12369  ORF Transcript_3985/g.12369 Transcript_3985/m.12369 type:complete len:211 (-) Transcript_3985:98-730(-)